MVIYFGCALLQYSLCASMHMYFMLHMLIQVCTLRRDECLLSTGSKYVSV